MAPLVGIGIQFLGGARLAVVTLVPQMKQKPMETFIKISTKLLECVLHKKSNK